MYFIYLNTFLRSCRFHPILSGVHSTKTLKNFWPEYFHALSFNFYVEMFCYIFAPQNVRFCFTGFVEDSDLVTRVSQLSSVREPLSYVSTADLHLGELTNAYVPDVNLSGGLEIPI